MQSMATNEGTVTLIDTLLLQDVLYVHELTCNLIFISQLLATSSYIITFTNKLCIIQDQNSRILIGVGEQSDGVYWFKPQRHLQSHQMTMLSKREFWYRRLRHPSQRIVSLLPFITNNDKIHSSKKEFCIRRIFLSNS